jgi:NodT family efflux transporter outer membrane factor (OMF) lipoprotein
MIAALGACALQAPYSPAPLTSQEAWANQPPYAQNLLPAAEQWWATLNDPVLDDIIETAFNSSPSLALAAAHLDEARATLGVQTSLGRPHVTLNGSAGRARVQSGGGSAISGTGGISGGSGSSANNTDQVGSSVIGGPSLAWEIDVFSRLRDTRAAASLRLDARTADAAAARLLLSSQVAGALMSLRACRLILDLKREDIASRQRGLVLTRRRVELGFAAPVDASRSLSGVSDAQVSLVNQDESCVKDLDSLVGLTGLSASEIETRLRSPASPPELTSYEASAFPKPPAATLTLPALVLARHPGVIAAEREVAATYAEIGVARANRLPIFNLTAALSGNWISASGTTIAFLGWSLIPTLSAPLFDGGAGAAQVDAATARYLAALASLNTTLRNTTQDIEDALTEQAHASERLAAAQRSRDAYQATFDATESQWRAGAIDVFQLEDTRRQREAADETAVDAARASVQAWVDIVRASGNAATFSTTLTEPD